MHNSSSDPSDQWLSLRNGVGWHHAQIRISAPQNVATVDPMPPWSMSRAEAAIAVSVLLDGIQLEFAMSRAQVRTKWADPSHVLNETQESSGHPIFVTSMNCNFAQSKLAEPQQIPAAYL